MLRQRITKQDLADLAWMLYITEDVAPYIISLITIKDIAEKNDADIISENDVVEPAQFFSRVESALNGNKEYPSAVQLVIRGLKEVLDVDLNQTPRYLNTPLLKVIVTWRLKLGI